MHVKNPVRHGATAALLMMLPFVVVSAIKKTQWGPVLATPINRQLGDPKAKVIVVEYSDFQCPSCARAQGTVRDLARQYEGKVRFAYKYFPLTKIHKNAMSAAHAGECAAEQNKFFPFIDRLFYQQSLWAPLPDPTTMYAAIAEQSTLDMARYTTCMQDISKLDAVRADYKEGEERQVKATPTFFIGDERLVGDLLATDGARTIERELRK